MARGRQIKQSFEKGKKKGLARLRMRVRRGVKIIKQEGREKEIESLRVTNWLRR